ncbi:TraB/GumN family protein [Paenibacillus harenae]|uniref:Uncharacterized protein YbaP (TraB family) n=1 Tax=Paenibacillus harenae TaxID=306543 RepID=A0ABT9U8W9_PAEHA|nr:TraB/GumN family protein [Paenibacillus harenae]MDQ0116102.1 uncharacterized protein YbaP (TraB family) [Paenibacillus harenae]
MKKIAALFLSLALLFSFVTSVQAEAKPVTVWVEGEQAQLDGQAPILERGTTHVPAESFLKELGFKVSWDEQGKTITGTKEDIVISIQVGKETANVNGTEQPLIAPKLVNKTLYVPLRFISETAGYEVTWNSELRAVYVEVNEPSRGFLWKVENEGNVVYLLGSIHIANDAMYPLRPEITNAFDASDYLVVEADITKANEPEVQELVLKLSTYTDGTTLKDHLSPETYAKLEGILKENGLPAGAFDMYKPWSVSTTLDYLKAMQSGYNGDNGIDMNFLAQAIERKVPIVELESIEFQLKMLDGFSAELQEEMLATSIENYYATESGIDELSEMWVTGDEEKLMAITNETGEHEELNKAMLTDRNIPMVDKIEGYLKDEDGETYFVVVGAAHMLGEDGIVPLLEKKGYKVIRQ